MAITQTAIQAVVDKAVNAADMASKDTISTVKMAVTDGESAVDLAEETVQGFLDKLEAARAAFVAQIKTITHDAVSLAP